jgi:hypothetical protein
VQLLVHPYLSFKSFYKIRIFLIIRYSILLIHRIDDDEKKSLLLHDPARMRGYHLNKLKIKIRVTNN